MTGVTLLNAIVGQQTFDEKVLWWRSMLDIMQAFRVQLMLSQDLVKNKRRGVS
jgi:hypothetical protein